MPAQAKVSMGRTVAGGPMTLERLLNCSIVHFEPLRALPGGNTFLRLHAIYRDGIT